jgi:hypothetical protein
MSPRDTRTGGVLENMILPALANGGYSYEQQVLVGERIGGRKHMVDVVANKDNEKFLISLKWQQVGGTAEQKVPFEVICLLKAIVDNEEKYKKAYLVLGGSGWTLRDFYTGGELEKFLKYSEKVDILNLEDFVGKANRGLL